MNSTFLMLTLKVQSLFHGEDGQDLVEYALLVALIALGVISSIGSVATAVTSVFTNVSTSLA